MKRLFCVLAAALLVMFSPARASTSTSDITDMWYVPAESGWGVNIILQNDVAFVTFFLYDTNQNPVWYTAQLTGQDFTFTWTGPLYATRGPWFGGAFPGLSSPPRQAGTATFTLITLHDATLTYIVDGVSVTKTLVRQFWTYENLTHTVAGGYSIRLTCTPSSLSGIQEQAGVMSIQHTNNTDITINAVFSSLSCNFTGAYSQSGKLGRVIGKYSCTDGTAGSFHMYEITPTVSGFTARVDGQNQSCLWTGYMGGISKAK